VKKCCKPFRLRTHWFTAVRRGTCFQAQRTNLSDRPSPELVRSRVILLCRVSSSEFLRSYSRPMPLRIKPSCRGFVPHGQHRARPLLRGVPILATFRPQAFPASRRFAPRTDSAGLFHPAAASRAHLAQGLLSRCSHSSSSEEATPLALGHDHSPKNFRCPQPYPSSSRS